MKIAIIGTRGIPNRYGGYEQFAEYLSVGLAKRGHQVTVYNSHQHPFQDKEWNGVKVSESIGTLRLYNGMGSYFSTVDDLVKWDQALYTEKLVKAATFQEATTPGKLNSGQSLNYGFGWELFRSKEIPYMLHAGGWAGFA